MAVMNLGQFGKQRESPVSGLGEALSTGIKSATDIGGLRATQDYLKLKEREVGMKQEQIDSEQWAATYSMMNRMKLETPKKYEQYIQGTGKEVLKAMKKSKSHSAFVNADGSDIVETPIKDLMQNKLEEEKARIDLEISQDINVDENRLKKWFLSDDVNAALMTATIQADIDRKRLEEEDAEANRVAIEEKKQQIAANKERMNKIMESGKSILRFGIGAARGKPDLEDARGMGKVLGEYSSPAKIGMKLGERAGEMGKNLGSKFAEWLYPPKREGGGGL